jgi:CheY-like chemotaxis protein
VPVVGARTILVVDDEPDVAATLAEALRHEGHDAHVATDGSGALEMLARQSYDLVVSDTKMPGMDGMSMYREVLRRFPELRGHVIFVTGDVLDPDKQKFLDDTGAPVLTKPFDIGELRRVVRRTLVAVSPPAGDR